MKTNFILVVFLISLILPTTAFSQKICSRKVPDKVKQAVHKEFPDAKRIKWTQSNKGYTAKFKIKKREYLVKSTESGTISEFHKQIAITDVSKMATNCIDKNFKNYEIEQAYKVTQANNTVLYSVKLKKGRSKVLARISIDGQQFSKQEIK